MHLLIPLVKVVSNGLARGSEGIEFIRSCRSLAQPPGPVPERMGRKVSGGKYWSNGAGTSGRS